MALFPSDKCLDCQSGATNCPPRREDHACRGSDSSSNSFRPHRKKHRTPTSSFAQSAATESEGLRYEHVQKLSRATSRKPFGLPYGNQKQNWRVRSLVSSLRKPQARRSRARKQKHVEARGQGSHTTRHRKKRTFDATNPHHRLAIALDARWRTQEGEGSPRDCPRRCCRETRRLASGARRISDSSLSRPPPPSTCLSVGECNPPADSGLYS